MLNNILKKGPIKNWSFFKCTWGVRGRLPQDRVPVYMAGLDGQFGNEVSDSYDGSRCDHSGL